MKDDKSIGLMRLRGRVLSAPIDVIGWESVLEKITTWANARESRYVCLCNAHSVVTANLNYDFRKVIDSADLALPDGAPVAWMLRRLGFPAQHRMPGPELMSRYCDLAQKTGETVFFYGGSPETVAALGREFYRRLPALKIVGSISPPYRQLSTDEDADYVAQINDSGAGVVFVSLGCPKQELWMANHRGKINAVMIGVGAAFDWHAGTMKRAPAWIQKFGLEWLHRLISEPRRLWKRYFVTNTLFILGAAKQLFLKGDKSEC